VTRVPAPVGLPLLLLLAACDGEAAPVGATTGDAAPPVDAAMDAPPIVSVTVTAEITYVTGQTEGRGAVDLSHGSVGVWSPTGEGFTFTPATFPSSGTARVEGIAAAPFWLQNGTVYFEGGPGQAAFDLGYTLLGSGNNLQALIRPTPLGVSLTGLQAWASPDELMMFSADAGERLRSMEVWLDPSPDVGASAVQGVLDYTLPLEHYLIGRGDETWFLQLAEVPGPVFETRALARYLRTTALVQRDGQSAQVTGDLTGGESRTLSLTWADDAFLAASSQPGLALGIPQRYVTVEVLPGVAAHGRYDSGAPLAELWSGAASVPPQPMVIPYADPFPASWGRAIVGAVWRSARITAPGLKTPLFWSLGVSVYGALSAFPEGQVTPLVGPPREPRVNGQPASEMSGVGTSPVLAWDPPALGHADYYSIEVYRVEADDSGTSTAPGATLYTTREEARLPPQILEPGQRYLVVIGAFADPGATPRSPYRHAQKQGYAQTMIGIVSP